MPFNVVVTDCDLGSLEQEAFEFEQVGARLIDCRGHTLDAIVEAAQDADALLVQWFPVGGELLQRLPRCRAVSRYGVGFDIIDLEQATKQGVHVFNVADYCIDEVAAHALMLLLALNRQLFVLSQTVREGKWAAAGQPPIRRLSGQILGIVGFGRIGQEVMRKARGLGLVILVHDPYMAASASEDHGVQSMSLPDLLAAADYVSLHCPLIPQTHHLIGRAELEHMKPGAYLINVSRGPLVDEHALLDALTQGHLAGAALDVLEHEPPLEGHPLLQLSNVIVTPHAAYHSAEALAELQRSAAQNIVRLFTGQELKNLVNPQVRNVQV